MTSSTNCPVSAYYGETSISLLVHLQIFLYLTASSMPCVSHDWNRTRKYKTLTFHKGSRGFMQQQSTLIVQQKHNSETLERLEKRHKKCTRLHPTRYGEESFEKFPNDIGTHHVGIADNNESRTISSLNISIDINHYTRDIYKVYDWVCNPSLNPTLCQIQTSTVITVVELDMEPYQLTTYSVGDFLTNRPKQTMVPNKYCSWWRVPFEITNVKLTDVKIACAISNPVTQHDYMAHTHLKPFYHDPNVKDEYIVDQIVGHNL